MSFCILLFSVVSISSHRPHLFLCFYHLIEAFVLRPSVVDQRTKPLLSFGIFRPCLSFAISFLALFSSPLYSLSCGSQVASLHRLSSVYTVKCPALISVGKHCKFLLTRLPSRYHVKLVGNNKYRPRRGSMYILPY